jgi:SAM-dependent methyltransferase
LDIPTIITREFEEELLARQPWMHPYRFAPDVIVGTFKKQGLEATVCLSRSPAHLREQMQQVYADYLASDPFWHLRELHDELGGLEDCSCLDIACATGLYSFALTDLGAGSVRGIEIRPEQVEQAKLLQKLAPERFERIVFEHEPVSADHQSFRSDETYDVVLSLGLLYHMTVPLQHLRNLRRLTRRALLLQTFTHAHEPGYWWLGLSNAAAQTKSIDGYGWLPHYADIPDLLRYAGFKDVKIVTSPQVAPFQAWDTRRTNRLVRLLLPGLAYSAIERARSYLFLRKLEAAGLGVAPRYYTFIASV